MPRAALPVHLWLKDRRRRRIKRWLVTLFVVAGCLWLIDRNEGESRFEREQIAIARAIDATTLELMTSTGPVRVRLAGIRTIDFQDGPAMDWLIDEATGRRGWVVFDEKLTRDERGYRYGYVYRADGRLVNEQLIRAGLAVADMDQPAELRRWFGELTWRAAGRREDVAEAVGLDPADYRN